MGALEMPLVPPRKEILNLILSSYMWLAATFLDSTALETLGSSEKSLMKVTVARNQFAPYASGS